MLETVCRVAAPLLPLTTEEVWRGLTGERSVHLTDWPDASDAARPTTSWSPRWTRCATSARRRRRCARPPRLRNRLPLATLTVVVEDAHALTGFESIVSDEVNVKDVRLLDAEAPEAASYGVSQRLTVNARAAGPRLGKDVQTAIKGSKSGDWSVAEDGTVTAGRAGAPGGRVHPRDRGRLRRRRDRDRHAARAAGSSSSTPRVTPELAAEGLARDLVRAVQQARRDADLEVSDRIALTIGGSDGGPGRRAHPRGADRRRDPRHVVRSGRPGDRIV